MNNHFSKNISGNFLGANGNVTRISSNITLIFKN